MKLHEIIKANRALTEMAGERWNYTFANAIFHTLRDLEGDCNFIFETESALARKYGKCTEKGEPIMQGGRLEFVSDEAREGFIREQKELLNSEAQGSYQTRRVKAPESIRPDHIMAIAGFIEFEEAGE